MLTSPDSDISPDVSSQFFGRYPAIFGMTTIPWMGLLGPADFPIDFAKARQVPNGWEFDV